jgi:hypothetical protein
MAERAKSSYKPVRATIQKNSEKRRGVKMKFAAAGNRTPQAGHIIPAEDGDRP